MRSLSWTTQLSNPRSWALTRIWSRISQCRVRWELVYGSSYRNRRMQVGPLFGHILTVNMYSYPKIQRSVTAYDTTKLASLTVTLYMKQPSNSSPTNSCTLNVRTATGALWTPND